MSTSGAGQAGQSGPAGHPHGPVPAARTTTGTGHGAGGGSGGPAADPVGRTGPADPTGPAGPADPAAPGAPGAPGIHSDPADLDDAGAAEPVLPGQRPYDFAILGLPELRALRRDSQRDEADLSYLRRLLQGRIDILRDELSRRTGPAAPPGQGRTAGARGRVEPAAVGAASAGAASGGAATSMVVRLAGILSDPPSAHRSSARHVTLSTPRGAEGRRLAAETLAEVELSDLAARTDDELLAALRRLVRNERQISRRRHRLQRTVDGCSAEIARRYREGEAQVDDLLT
ncbi:hypothetical protein AB0910_25270 [Streptomyces sp. NPDC047002]|uniref:RsiG family protein n=1 Tax=Streptomyces sp. NPDC047002 TaxID=3155475 RepID=UPI003451E38E